MNCLNKSLVSAGAGAAIRRAIGAVAGISSAGVAPGLKDGGREVFTSVEVELLEREILRESLADLLRPTATSCLATLWAAAPCNGAWRGDRAI